MQALVKVNDLEELAEPLLGGTWEASTLWPPKEEMLDLEMEEAMWEDDNTNA